jgi:glycosyltransferase involved in cell wall biosynthesis
LEYELNKIGLKVERQKELPVDYDILKLDADYRIDLLVENQIMLELKSDKAISATIPGKLQSYLAANKYILGFIDGEAKKIIENSKIGSVVHPDDINELAKKIITLESNRALLKVEKNLGSKFLDINFNKDKLLNNLSIEAAKITAPIICIKINNLYKVSSLS